MKPPVSWNKGHAVSLMLKRITVGRGKSGLLPIFIGDDATDEDAFRAIKNKGLTIFVGKPKKSCAQYYLRDDKEV
ncbi:MAG: trehalose-phosphatase [Candidatus Omnitrophota bacterium]